MRDNWPIYEVFIRSRGGIAHRHVGSVHASDPEMALSNARDIYTRRMEGVSIWVLPASEVTASAPDDAQCLFDPAKSKLYRYPSFYDIPDDIDGL